MKQIEKTELKPEFGESRLGFSHKLGQCSQEVEGECGRNGGKFQVGSGCRGCVVYTLLLLCQKQRQKQRKREVTAQAQHTGADC